jgi:hypothetical protein
VAPRGAVSGLPPVGVALMRCGAEVHGVSVSAVLAA